MKKIILALCVLVMGFALISCTSGASGAPVKVFMVGDSTVSSFNDPFYYPRFGYGTKFGEYFDNITVVNYALSGRSSKSFTSEMNYRKLKNEIGKGDFLIIGFGHNDEKNDGERYTDPTTGIEDTKSFKYYLYEKYIKLALDVKATPILATPIVRRAATADAKYEGSLVHVTKDIDNWKGGDYAQVIRELGKEKGVYVIDNTKLTKELYESLGSEKTLKLHAWLNEKPTSVDNTHLNAYGAHMVSYLMAKDLKASNSKLGKYVKKDIAEPVEVLVLDKNPNFIIPKYRAPADNEKTFWKTTSPWMGTVFGDCGDQMSIDPVAGFYAINETASGVNMRSGVEGGKSLGKIASTSDGMAFYFQKVPANKDFVLTAKAKVKFITKNNQVSFGLMVRDDVYIDKYDNSIASNYVAVGPLKMTADPITTSWQRKNGALDETKGKVSKCPVAGDTVNFSITKMGDKYTLVYGNEAPVTIEANLKEVDKENVFAGLYTVRNVEVDFSDIVMKIK
ncbi:MAG: rhamnogalacturonan acetylesterase [Treponema sp.]|jgi:lysophospholipase L1-like esterase|nr:rhamnogalacturonan acetylesterase [Treponema sp.]